MRRLTVDQVRPALGAVTRLSSRGAPSGAGTLPVLRLSVWWRLMFLLLAVGLPPGMVYSRHRLGAPALR